MKGHKIDEGRIEGICKDIKRFKTLEGLKGFLRGEIIYINQILQEIKETEEWEKYQNEKNNKSNTR